LRAQGVPAVVRGSYEDHPDEESGERSALKESHGEGARTERPSRAAAGEDPDALRNRLKDASQAQNARLSDEREELQAAARDREPEQQPAKRRWRRAR
jgi:hypothetical protein